MPAVSEDTIHIKEVKRRLQRTMVSHDMRPEEQSVAGINAKSPALCSVSLALACAIPHAAMLIRGGDGKHRNQNQAL